MNITAATTTTKKEDDTNGKGNGLLILSKLIMTIFTMSFNVYISNFKFLTLRSDGW